LAEVSAEDARRDREQVGADPSTPDARRIGAGSLSKKKPPRMISVAHLLRRTFDKDGLFDPLF
jgi:hypothetical protein